MKRTPSILIVEDDQDIRLLLQEIFRTSGLPVYATDSLKAAKESICNDKPTHLILDNKLPDGYGKNLIPYLTKFHPNIKVIFLSGDTTEVEEVIEQVFTFIQKPFTVNVLKEALKDLII